MLSYAGVYLGDPTVEVAAWVASNVPTADCYPMAPRYYAGLGFLGDSPYRPQMPPGPVQVGRLWYPWGAARFAVGYYVVDTDSLKQIRDYCYPDSQNFRDALFVMDDGVGNVVQTSLWMLPPRPLSQIEDDPGLWLLTLVDERYYWWWKSITLTPASSWLDLYEDIGTAIPKEILVDSIDEKYLTPPADFRVYYPPLPVLLDAVASSVGQRIVRRFDGTIKAQSAANAQNSWETQQETFASLLLAGGRLAI